MLLQVEQMISMGKLIRRKHNLLGDNSSNAMRTQQGMVNIMATSYSVINDTPDNSEGLFYTAPDDVTVESLVSYDHNVISSAPEILMALTDSDTSSRINSAMDIYVPSSHSPQANSLTLDGSNDLTSVAMNEIALQSQDNFQSISMSSNSSNEYESSQAILIPFQLTSGEFDLLEIIMKDSSVRRGHGVFNWDIVHAKFMEQAIIPNNTIYNRTKERLISSNRKRKWQARQNSELTSATIAPDPCDISDSVSLDVDSASNSTNLISNSATSSYEPSPSSYIIDSPSLDIHSAAQPTNLTSVPAASSPEPNLLSHTESHPPRAIGPVANSSRVVMPLQRNDNLDPEERDFVHTYGKERMNEGKDVDKKALWNAYRIEFPQWSRHSDKVKKCWDNWKCEDSKKKRKISR